MPDEPMRDLRRQLTLARFQARLLERGLDPTYVRGLLADEDILAKLEIDVEGNATAHIAAVARSLPVSRKAERESAEEWAARVFSETGGEDGANAVARYIKGQYVTPSQATKISGKS